MFVIYKITQGGRQIRQTDGQGTDELNVKSQHTYPGGPHLVPPLDHGLGPVDAPFVDLAQSTSNISCPTEEQLLERSGSSVWEHFPVNHEVSVATREYEKHVLIELTGSDPEQSTVVLLAE